LFVYYFHYSIPRYNTTRRKPARIGIVRCLDMRPEIQLE
jgi:hypothetical protein